MSRVDDDIRLVDTSARRLRAAGAPTSVRVLVRVPLKLAHGQSLAPLELPVELRIAGLDEFRTTHGEMLEDLPNLLDTARAQGHRVPDIEIPIPLRCESPGMSFDLMASLPVSALVADRITYEMAPRVVDSDALLAGRLVLRSAGPVLLADQPGSSLPPIHIDVHMPEQPPPNVTVNVPQQPAPVVNVEVPERRKRIEIERDGSGRIDGAVVAVTG